MKTTQLGAALNSLCILTKLIFRAITGFLLLCLALWIQRVARFLDKTEPGPAFVVVIGCVIGLSVGFFSADMHHSDVNMPLRQCLWIGLVVCFKYGFTGLAMLYSVWEVFQGFKWLGRWSDRYPKISDYRKIAE